MKNFRIGDSVQILRSAEDEWGLVGEVGRVIRIDDDGMAYEVTGVGESSTNGSGWWYCEEDLCLVCTPLDVPEPTTWGESGGEEAITLYDSLVSSNRWMLGDNFRALVDHYRDIYWMAEHSKGLVEGDIVQAMNFLERSKKRPHRRPHKTA